MARAGDLAQFPMPPKKSNGPMKILRGRPRARGPHISAPPAPNRDHLRRFPTDPEKSNQMAQTPCEGNGNSFRDHHLYLAISRRPYAIERGPVGRIFPHKRQVGTVFGEFRKSPTNLSKRRKTIIRDNGEISEGRLVIS